MSCSATGILAIFFMDRLENIALSSHRFIRHYKRYTCGRHLQTTNEFHQTINSVHPKIEFEIEKPTPSTKCLSLSLLDFTITISDNGESLFEFYTKPSKKLLFAHPASALSTQELQNQLHPQLTTTHTTEVFNTDDI